MKPLGGRRDLTSPKYFLAFLSLGIVTMLIQLVLIRLFLSSKIKPCERGRAFKKTLQYLLHKVFVALLLLDSERFKAWFHARVVLWYILGLVLFSMLRNVLALGEELLEQAMLLAGNGVGEEGGPFRRPVWQLICVAVLLHTIIVECFRGPMEDRRPGPNIHTLLIYEVACFFVDGVVLAGKARLFTQDEGESNCEQPSTVYGETLGKLIPGVVVLIAHCHAWMIKGVGSSHPDIIMLFMFQSLIWNVFNRLWGFVAAVRIARTIDARYPDATREDLAKLSDDDCCAVCLRAMKTGVKKLPCSHFYHLHCLQSVLAKSLQDMEPSRCPLCRRDISGCPQTEKSGPTGSGTSVSPLVPLRNRQAVADVPAIPVAEHPDDRSLFRVTSEDLSGWISLPLPLPTFSFEVVRRGRPGQRQQENGNRELEAMANQVLEIFPHWSRDSVLASLRVTRRVEDTVERLLLENAADDDDEQESAAAPAPAVVEAPPQPFLHARQSLANLFQHRFEGRSTLRSGAAAAATSPLRAAASRLRKTHGGGSGEMPLSPPEPADQRPRGLERINGLHGVIGQSQGAMNGLWRRGATSGRQEGGRSGSALGGLWVGSRHSSS